MMSRTIAPSVALTTRATIPVPRWIPKWGQQPISNERPNNADDQVADEAVATTAHNVSSKPPGDDANDNDSDRTFIR
jgi:hypothetical protein